MCCKPEDDDLADPAFGSARVKSWKRHKWRSEELLTRSQLQARCGQAWVGRRVFGSSGRSAFLNFHALSPPRPALASAATVIHFVLLQRMRDEFWETEPHYGGDRGEHPSCLEARDTGTRQCAQPTGVISWEATTANTRAHETYRGHQLPF